MFIKNQEFNDEDTLLEQLFDFGLGTASAAMAQLVSEIDAEVLGNAAFNAYRATLTDEEDIMELDAEERRIRLAERLMALYPSFRVAQGKLYGLPAGDAAPELLYEVDLY